MNSGSDSSKIRLRLRTSDASPDQRAKNALPPWPVLVVDDDPQIHDMSRILLRDFEFQGRSFAVISAFSAAEAFPLIAAHPDVPILLLDVVMENEQAGLDLVRRIRQDLDNQRLRIILRTGYPGQAPGRQVMLDYDINDYRTKSDLTADQLFAALVGALRSWSHIDTIETMNQALEKRVAERTQQLATARAFADHLLDHVPAPMWVCDQQGELVRSNQAFADFFAPLQGLPPQLFPGGSAITDQEIVLETPHHGHRTVLLHQTPLPDLPDPTRPHHQGGTIGLLFDISLRKQLEAELCQLAMTDPLTGCFNRRHFFQHLEQATSCADPAGTLSLLLLDVDHFKQVNDQHGHLVGDQLLRHLVRLTLSLLPEQALLARFGGEEFAIITQCATTPAEHLAEHIRATIAANPLFIGNQNLAITVSIGVVRHNPASDNTDSLLARADSALYRAKGGGRNCVISL